MANTRVEILEGKKYRAEANKRWKKEAVWISGYGQYALLAHCRVLTVTLWDNMKDAQKQKDSIDRLACGGRCFGDHEIVDLLED